jgi:hypothetical protein
MTTQPQIQYVSDADDRPVSVIVPIELWREIASERETACLVRSANMKQRLLAAKQRSGGISSAATNRSTT